MVWAELPVSVASLSDLLSRFVAISRNISGFAPFWTSEFHEDYLRVKCQLERLQKICQKYSPLSISVNFCAAHTDPANAAENLLTEALRLLEIAEQFHKDAQVSSQRPRESQLFLSGFSITSSESEHLSGNETAPPTILVCYVGEHESACQNFGLETYAMQLLSSLPRNVSRTHREGDILGVVFASKSSRSSYLKAHIPIIYINYQKSWIRNRHAGSLDTDDLRFPREPGFPYFSPTEEPVMLNVKSVELGELCDCIAWSVHLLAQKGASMVKSSNSSFLTFRQRQWRTERQISDFAHGLDHPIRDLDPHRLWWSTLALFWIAFAERTIDGTELMSALASAGADRVPINSNFFAGQVRDSGDLLEVGLKAILSESGITSEDGRIILSSEQAKAVLLDLVSDPRGTDEASIHEMIAYTCLSCIEHHQPASIFRPWTVIECCLDHQSTSSSLLLYAASHWHVHFRLGEHRSQRLSALFHRVIQLALSTDNIVCQSGRLGSIQLINVGMWLCAFYDFKVLGRTYLEMGADLVATSWPETCPLHVAASKPSLGVLEMFLTRQPELSVINHEGMTPLQVAVFHGHVAAVKMLLAAGSDFNDTFIASKATALHIAVHGGHEKIVALLLEQGADVDAKNVLSESPLRIALHEGKYAIAKMLLNKGASSPPFSAMEQSMAEAVYAFRVLSFAERGASPTRELLEYVVQESARLEIHLEYCQDG